MALRDLVSNVALRESVRPAVHTASVNGESVDTRGFDSAMVAIAVGAIAASGNMTPKLQSSDNNSTWADVTADDLEGSFPASLEATSVVKVGYRGPARYLRAVMTLNSGTSVATSAMIVLGNAHQRPA